ncbi:MAG: thioredoxin family protein [Hydrogenophaga sp.]|nr:thioredoxin family protein [Hydrogenophaga sp.]
MLQVVCLCAEWCSACRAWRPEWDAAAARHPQHRWQWLDIEEEVDLMDEVGLDIETFPTVLIAREGRALFLSAIPPQAAFLDNLIARLSPEGAAPQGVTPEAVALAQRLAARGR